MDTKTLGRVWIFLPLVAIMVLVSGCAARKYAPVRYQSSQDRFGAIILPTTKIVYLCPTIDSLPPDCRNFLDPKFTPWEHATDAIEQELKASGINPVRPGFSFGPSFERLKQGIAEKANKTENAVYLGTELLWLTAWRWTLDAKLFSPTGDVLFEKRGTCVVFGLNKVDTQEITHMALRQILADPQFKMVLQQ